METKIAVTLFLGVCIVLAIFLLTNVIEPLLGAILFAVALVVFGIQSGGFRNQKR